MDRLADLSQEQLAAVDIDQDMPLRADLVRLVAEEMFERIVQGAARVLEVQVGLHFPSQELRAGGAGELRQQTGGRVGDFPVVPFLIAAEPPSRHVCGQ